MDLQAIKREIVAETQIRIEKKKQSNKTYVKLDLFASRYLVYESMSETQMNEITDLVVDELLNLGYNIDLEKNKIYW